MRNNLVIVLAAVGMGLSAPAFAQDAAPAPETEGPAKIMQDADATLTCAQVGDQAARLSETMGGDPEGSLFGALGGIVRSGAAMLIPGAGLAMAGADALNKPGRDRREAEQLATQNRWYYLNGLYAGRRCHDQAEAVVDGQATAVAPSPVTTPAPVR